MMTAGTEPIISDYTLQAKLYPVTQGFRYAGRSISCASNGNTLFSTSGLGLRFYTRSGSTWSSPTGISGSYSGFGETVKLSGDASTMVTQRGNDPAYPNGSVEIFISSGGTFVSQAVITGTLGTTSGTFGENFSISSDGNILVVTERKARVSGNSDVGCAYVFTRSGSTWTQRTVLYASDPTASAEFGYNTAISSDGTTIAVAAARDSSGISFMGAVYVYTGSGSSWSQQAKIVAPSPQANDFFGLASGLALSTTGSTLAVGAYGRQSGAGSTLIYTRSGSTWSFVSELVAPYTGQAGWAVAINGAGSLVLVGTPASSLQGSNSGLAVVFENPGSGWTQTAMIFPSDGAAGDKFGYSVAISSDGQTNFMGAPDDDGPNGTDQGSVYVYLP